MTRSHWCPLLPVMMILTERHVPLSGNTRWTQWRCRGRMRGYRGYAWFQKYPGDAGASVYIWVVIAIAIISCNQLNNQGISVLFINKCLSCVSFFVGNLIEVYYLCIGRTHSLWKQRKLNSTIWQHIIRCWNNMVQTISTIEIMMKEYE